MKKIILLFSFVAAALLNAKDTHSHKIMFTFTLEASPESQEEWTRIEELFLEPFVRSAKSDENNKVLLDRLGEAFDAFPNHCQEHHISGSSYINVSVTHPNDVIS